MPRIKAYKRKYMLNDLSDYIRHQMEEQKIKQEDLSIKLGCSQQTISYKMRTHSFNLNDLITIFTLFDTAPEDLERLLKE